MAVTFVESLVLRGNPVAYGVVAGLEPTGSMQADGRAPTVHLSHTRHPSRSYPLAGPERSLRLACAEDLGAASAATRAGRPGSSAGVLDSRMPAIKAGGAILSGWSRTVRRAQTTCWRAGNPSCPPLARFTRAFSGHKTVGQRGPVAAGIPQRMPGLLRSCKGATA